MRAIQVLEYGGREGLRGVDVPRPEPGPGEVLVKLEYVGINFIDVYMREGRYKNSATYGAALPFTLGMEGSGCAVQAGDGVREFSAGDRVAYCLSRGSYAEYAVVPAWKLVRVPTTVPLDIATVLMLQGCTAHYLSHSLYPLKPGDWCLVHAGAGGVGQLLVQLAKIRGARVIATVGTDSKRRLAEELGADHVILYREVDFADAVREITAGDGVHVVYDSVGRDTIDGSLRSLRRRGTCVNFGGSSGAVENIKPMQLAEAGSVFFTRPHLAHYMHDAAEIRGRADELFAYLQSGALKVKIDTEFGLPDAAEAHAVLEARQTTGKLLLNTHSEE